MPKITTYLWFDNQAEEAARFYTSLFPNSRINARLDYNEASYGRSSGVMNVGFTLDSREFVALNGGPVYQFTPAISLMVHCRDQAEVDFYWEKLLEGGQAQQCGWLTDKFGVTWQVVPDALFAMLSDGDQERVKRVTEAMLQMVKLDLNALQTAYDQA